MDAPDKPFSGPKGQPEGLPIIRFVSWSELDSSSYPPASSYKIGDEVGDRSVSQLVCTVKNADGRGCCWSWTGLITPGMAGQSEIDLILAEHDAEHH